MNLLETYYKTQAEISIVREATLHILQKQTFDISAKVANQIVSMELNDGQFLSVIPSADPKLEKTLKLLTSHAKSLILKQYSLDFEAKKFLLQTKIAAIENQPIQKIEVEGENFIFCLNSYWEEYDGASDLEIGDNREQKIHGTFCAASKVPVVQSLPEFLAQKVKHRIGPKISRIQINRYLNSTCLRESSDTIHDFPNCFIYRNRFYHWKVQQSSDPIWIVDPETSQKIEKMVQITVSAPFSPKVEV